MPDINPIDSTKGYFVSQRAIVGRPRSFYPISVDYQISSTASGISPRVNKDILYPYASGTVPVSSGLVYLP